MGQMGPPSSGATSGVFDQSGQQTAQVNLFNPSQSTRKSLKNLRKTINYSVKRGQIKANNYLNNFF